MNTLSNETDRMMRWVMNQYIKLYVYLISFWLCLATVRSANPVCTAVMTDDFANCKGNSSNYFAYKDTLESECLHSTQSNNGICIHESQCQHVFNLSYFPQQLFSSTMEEIVVTMFKRCCANCFRCNAVNRFTNISQLTPAAINTSDVIFPVLGHSSMSTLFGYHFIPVLEVPHSFYFTLKESGNAKMTKVILACVGMWPLLLICLLMSLISGFLTWIMETHKNEAQFPRPFHIGVFEGFWWGFVSMTTVGYGDKTPKTVFGRLFAVIWILIGITVCSIFTASLTTEIINARKPSDPDMTGKRIGILSHRMHDSTLVSQHGGMIEQVDIYKTTHGINRLMDMLLSGGSIDGFIINQNTYFYFIRKRKDLGKKWRRMIKTEKRLEGKPIVSGILVKHKEHFNYFKKYFENNRLQLQSCHRFRLNHKKHEDHGEKPSLFSTDGGLFSSFLYYSLGILLVIGCFGIYFEAKRYVKARRLKKSEEDVGEDAQEDKMLCCKARILESTPCVKCSH